MPALGMQTRSKPTGIDALSSRNASRMSRLTRLRQTALPCFLPTLRPILEYSKVLAATYTTRERSASEQRLPKTREKSLRPERRRARGRRWLGGWGLPLGLIFTRVVSVSVISRSTGLYDTRWIRDDVTCGALRHVAWRGARAKPVNSSEMDWTSCVFRDWAALGGLLKLAERKFRSEKRGKHTELLTIVGHVLAAATGRAS